MPLKPMLPALLLAFALSILVAVLATTRGASVPLALAAGLFALQVLFALARINEPLWRTSRGRAAEADWAWSNTVLAALVYAWGATAMFTIYSLSGLAWRHWWQYGAGMALFACMALLCANYLTKDHGPLKRTTSLNVLMGVTAAQAIAVVAGLAYLVGSGKLQTEKADWAANHIFITGGIAIAVISIVSLLAHRRQHSAPQVSA
jgi:hypothetical protein